jgi:hypothetical protein
MPGPRRLHELTARLRGPDPRTSLAALAGEVVPGQVGPADHIVAVAWATPDLERAMTDTPVPFERCARDRVLDGDAAAVQYGPLLLLLERPRTRDEGPIAAFLARYGEGVVGVFLERPGFLAPTHATGRQPRPKYTPFGRRAWLVPPDWPWGPFVIALEQQAPRSR